MDLITFKAEGIKTLREQMNNLKKFQIILLSSKLNWEVIIIYMITSQHECQFITINCLEAIKPTSLISSKLSL